MGRSGSSGRASSPGRQILLWATLAAVALASSFAAAELVLRLHYREVVRITGATQWQTASWQGLTYHWDLYHPRYGWTNLPGYRSDGRVPFRVTINGQGLRGEREAAPRPAPGVARIALFGDSLAFGEEVDDDQTVGAYLEHHLRDDEVLNFGVHGYGLGQMILRLEDEAFRFHPHHLVLLLMLPEDLRRDGMRHFVHEKPVFSTRNGQLRIENVPVPEASQLPWPCRVSFAAAFFCARAEAADRRAGWHAQLEVAELLLRRLAERAAVHEVPLTLATVTNARDLRRMQTDPELRARFETARDAIAATGLDVLDLAPTLERHWRAEGSALQTRFWHWSPRGNCLIAAALAEHLAADGFQARAGARCKTLVEAVGGPRQGTPGAGL